VLSEMGPGAGRQSNGLQPSAGGGGRQAAAIGTPQHPSAALALNPWGHGQRAPPPPPRARHARPAPSPPLSARPGYSLLHIQLGRLPWRLAETAPRRPDGCWSGRQLAAWAAAKEEAIASFLATARPGGAAGAAAMGTEPRPPGVRGRLQNCGCCWHGVGRRAACVGGSAGDRAPAPLPAAPPRAAAQAEAPGWWRAWAAHLGGLPRGGAPDYSLLRAALVQDLAPPAPAAPPRRRTPDIVGGGGARKRRAAGASGGGGGGGGGGEDGGGPGARAARRGAKWLAAQGWGGAEE
jgi:hypothetical protein